METNRHEAKGVGIFMQGPRDASQTNEDRNYEHVELAFEVKGF